MTLPFLKVLMALAVANATPSPEAGLLFRKPMGMVWAKGGGVGGNGSGTGVNTEVSIALPSWDCVVPTAEARSARGVCAHQPLL